MHLGGVEGYPEVSLSISLINNNRVKVSVQLAVGDYRLHPEMTNYTRSKVLQGGWGGNLYYKYNIG